MRVLIVGGGFCGMAISWELEKRQIPYRIADPLLFDSSTAIAAGLINPVSGRKYALQWNIDSLIACVKKEIGAIEQWLGEQLLFSSSILKIHKSESALEEWLKRAHDEDLKKYTTPISDIIAYSRWLDARYGAISVHPALRIETSLMIKKYFEKIADKHLQTMVEHDAITVRTDGCVFHGEQYSHIIFCEGVRAIVNPWFRHIPFKPAKGECLIIHVPDLLQHQMIHKGVIMIPLGENKWWVGATNSWNDLDPSPTKAGLQELQEGLKHLLKIPYTILAHKSAIRPTIKDRTPVAGAHHQLPFMYVLNGMGTKGASLSNYYASALIEHILEGKPIPAEADVRRFDTLV